MIPGYENFEVYDENPSRDSIRNMVREQAKVVPTDLSNNEPFEWAYEEDDGING